MSLIANVTSSSGVISAKYCITSDENCTPNQDFKTPSNSMTFEVPSVANKAQRVCFKVTTVTGDLSNVVCTDKTYIVDSSTIGMTWSINNVLVGTNGWDKSLSLKGTVTGSATKATYCVKTNGECTPDTGASISGAIFNVPISQNASAQTACATVTDQYNYTTDKKCTTPTTYKVDSSNPSIGWTVASSSVGQNGWYTGVTIHYNLSDSISGVSSSKYCIASSACTPGTNASLSSNTYNVSLPNGGNLETCANVTDNAGNTSSNVCSSNYYIDNVIPTITGLNVTANDSTVNVSMSASDNTSGIWYYIYQIDGGSQYGSGSTSYNFMNIADGTHTVNVWARDWAGNYSAVATRSVTVETTNAVKIIKEAGLCTSVYDNDCRYRGAGAKNYVNFNCGNVTKTRRGVTTTTYQCEKWRIIGIFYTKNSSGEYAYRLKLLSSNYVDGIAFDENNNSTYWGESPLYSYLNSYKYNSYYTETKNYIDSIDWDDGNCGGSFNTGNFANYYYSSKNHATNANVGMITAADFVYSFSDDTISSFSKSGTLHREDSWMSGAGHEWMMTSIRKGSAWEIMDSCGGSYCSGKLTSSQMKWSSTSSGHTFSARPVVTLKKSVKIISGDGTYSNPYNLSL